MESSAESIRREERDPARPECNSRLHPRSKEAAAAGREAVSASQKSARTKEAAATNWKIASQAVRPPRVPVASVDGAAGRPRIKLDRPERGLIVRNILLEQCHQRLRLLRA